MRMFKGFLTYKAERVGKKVIEISERNTTKACCQCGKHQRMSYTGGSTVRMKITARFKQHWRKRSDRIVAGEVERIGEEAGGDEMIQDELTIKTNLAIERIKSHIPKEGYYLAFSGGKDSIVIYDLAKKAGVIFDAHFSRTTVDPPEVLLFIKENYPEVAWEKPKKSMFKLILDNSTLPTKTHRICCRILKEIGGKGRVVILGIRWEESANRRSRAIYHESRVIKGKWFLNPIIDWTTQDIWDYIRRNNLKYCSLYDEGKKRIGCILCPFHSLKDKLDDIQRYPKFVRAYKLTIKKLYDKMKERGKLPKKWTSPEAIWEWWIYGKELDHTTVQVQLEGMR